MNKSEQIKEILSRGVDEVIDRKHLEQRLKSSKKLRIKLGIDPTSPNIHIGRAVALWKLRAFQDLGHKVIFIIGDFTGIIGDSSDKDSERPLLTFEQVRKNMKTYAKQAFQILDPKKTEVRYNSEWLGKLGHLEMARMANLFGLKEFMSREVIARRLKVGKRVSYLETLYPLFQGYDSVAVKADVELGGIDQRFNLLTGRPIQKYYKQEPQDIITVKYLLGTDGRKMSSSWGNVINLTDKPNDMYGKVMSLPDNLIIQYFELATLVPLSKIKEYAKKLKSGTNPRDLKVKLATEIVSMYHGKQKAAKATAEFDKVFSKKDKPSRIKSVKVNSRMIVDVLFETKLVSSNSEARRLIQQGGVRLNDQVITDIHAMPELKSGSILQVGKRKFVKIK
jgi:tyrosyl-tRNA synthetase